MTWQKNPTTMTDRLKNRVSFTNFVIVGLLLGLLVATVMIGDTPARGVFVFIAMLVMLIGLFMFASRPKPGVAL